LLAASARSFSPVDRQDEVLRVDERRQYSDDQVDDYDYDDDHDDEDDDDDDDDDDDGENDEDTMLLLNDITGSSDLNIWYCRVLLSTPLISSSSLCFSIAANYCRLELSDV
jgi:ABC-type Zn2+ transport system substrate-binding protein/surface adhesin